MTDPLVPVGDYRMSWPITDPTVPLDRILAAASQDLHRELTAQGLTPTGRARWQITHAHGLNLSVCMAVLGARRLLEPDDTPIEIPTPVDPVVVDRLVAAYPHRIWDQIGATRDERLAAAELLDQAGHQQRTRLHAAGWGDQQITAPSRTLIDRALSLRAGRDYPHQRTQEVA